MPAQEAVTAGAPRSSPCGADHGATGPCCYDDDRYSSYNNLYDYGYSARRYGGYDPYNNQYRNRNDYGYDYSSRNAYRHDDEHWRLDRKHQDDHRKLENQHERWHVAIQVSFHHRVADGFPCHDARVNNARPDHEPDQ